MIQAITNQQIGLKYACLQQDRYSSADNLFAKCDHRTYNRLCSARTTFGDDAIQDMGLYRYGASLAICVGLQIRPLYENSSSTNVRLSSHLYYGCGDSTAGRSSVDVREYR